MIAEVRYLTGVLLDWAVATCEYPADTIEIVNNQVRRIAPDNIVYHPTTNWAQAGQIIEREKLDWFWNPISETWSAAATSRTDEEIVERDSSPLVAAMRCFVASKVGKYLYIPEVLTADPAVSTTPASDLAKKILDHCYGTWRVDDRMIEDVAKIIADYPKA